MSDFPVVCILHVCGTHGGQKRILDTMVVGRVEEELEGRGWGGVDLIICFKKKSKLNLKC